METEGNSSEQTISVKNRARKISKRIKVINKAPKDDENSGEQAGLQPQKRRVRASVRGEVSLKDRVANLEGGGEGKKKTIRVRKSVRKSVRDAPDEEMRRKFHSLAADNDKEEKCAASTLHPAGPGTKKVQRESVRMIKTSLSTRRRAFLSAQKDGDSGKTDSKAADEHNGEDKEPVRRVSRRIRVKSIKVRPTEGGEVPAAGEGAENQSIKRMLAQGHSRRIPASQMRRSVKMSQGGDEETTQTLSADSPEQGALSGRPGKLRMSRIVKFQTKPGSRQQKDGATDDQPAMIRKVSTRKVRRSIRLAPEKNGEDAKHNENGEPLKVLGDGKITVRSGNQGSFARKSIVRVSRRVKPDSASSLGVPRQEGENKENDEGVTVGRPRKLRLSKYVKVQDKQGTVRRVVRASARHATPLAARIKAFKDATEEGKKEDEPAPKPQYRKKYLDAFIKEAGEEGKDGEENDSKPVQVRRVSKRIVRKSMRNAPSLRTRAKQLHQAQNEPDRNLEELKQQRLNEAADAIEKKPVALPIGTYTVIPDSDEDEEPDPKETAETPMSATPYEDERESQVEEEPTKEEEKPPSAPVPAKRSHKKVESKTETRDLQQEPSGAEESQPSPTVGKDAGAEEVAADEQAAQQAEEAKVAGHEVAGGAEAPAESLEEKADYEKPHEEPEPEQEPSIANDGEEKQKEDAISQEACTETEEEIAKSHEQNQKSNEVYKETSKEEPETTEPHQTQEQEKPDEVQLDEQPSSKEAVKPDKVIEASTPIADSYQEIPEETNVATDQQAEAQVKSDQEQTEEASSISETQNEPDTTSNEAQGPTAQESEEPETEATYENEPQDIDSTEVANDAQAKTESSTDKEEEETTIDKVQETVQEEAESNHDDTAQESYQGIKDEEVSTEAQGEQEGPKEENTDYGAEPIAHEEEGDQQQEAKQETVEKDPDDPSTNDGAYEAEVETSSSAQESEQPVEEVYESQDQHEEAPMSAEDKPGEVMEQTQVKVESSKPEETVDADDIKEDADDIKEDAESQTTEIHDEDTFRAEAEEKAVEDEPTAAQPKPIPRKARQETAAVEAEVQQNAEAPTEEVEDQQEELPAVESPVRRSDKTQKSFKRVTMSASDNLPEEIKSQIRPKQDVLLNEAQLDDVDYDEHGQLIINEKWRMRCRAKYIHIYRQHAKDAADREDKEREEQLLQKIREMEAQPSYVPEDEEQKQEEEPSKPTLPVDLSVDKAEVYSDVSDRLSDKNEVVAAEDQQNFEEEEESEYEEEEEEYEEEEYYEDEEEYEEEYDSEEEIEYVDEDDEDDEYEEEEEVVVYVDEDGNEIEVGDDVEFDEDGNQIIYVTDSEEEEIGSDEEVVYVDEDGNYVDADGNPIDEDEVEVVEEYEDGSDEEDVIYLDEDGNYVDADGNIVDYVPDSDDEIIEE